MPGPTRCSSAARCRRRCASARPARGAVARRAQPGRRGLLFVLCLYPYVYLLARTALGERAVQLMEAARLLGAPGLRRRVLEVALPLARPAIAAGVALALMETLADYGVGAYFGLATFSTGIYKAWLVMNDRIAAAQLAVAAAGGGGAAAVAERGRSGGCALPPPRAGPARRREARPCVLRGAAAAAGACCARCRCCWASCCRWLAAAMLWQEAQLAEFGLPLDRFAAGPGQLPAGGAGGLAGHAAGAGAGLRAAAAGPAGCCAAARLCCRWAMPCPAR
jgi:iron(III) transport system permease protein